MKVQNFLIFCIVLYRGTYQKKKKKNPEYVSKAYLLLSGQEMSHGISNIFKQLLDTNIENIIKYKVLF